MIKAVNRTLFPRALVITGVFSAIFFGTTGYLYATTPSPSLHQWRIAIELVGFAIGGLIYGLFSLSRASEYQDTDLIGVGVWVVLATGSGSLFGGILTPTGDLGEWTMLGIFGELLAVVVTFAAILVRNPSIIKNQQRT